MLEVVRDFLSVWDLRQRVGRDVGKFCGTAIVRPEPDSESVG